MKPSDQQCGTVDHLLLRFFIGLIGMTLGLFSLWIARSDPKPPYEELSSISHSYHYWDYSQNFFVGALCFIGIGLIVYRGHPSNMLGLKESIWSKIAGVCLIVVAFVPTAEKVGDASPVHFGAAAIVFGILTLFCLFSFRKHAWSKYKKSKGADYIARWRAGIYTLCGGIMVLCMVMILLYAKWEIQFIKNPVFWGEAVALSAFGIAWLTASRIIDHPDTRLKLKDLL